VKPFQLLRLKLLKIVPSKTSILIQTWSLIERYHIFEADALQILSAKQIGAEKLYTEMRFSIRWRWGKV